MCVGYAAHTSDTDEVGKKHNQHIHSHYNNNNFMCAM